MPEGDRFYGVPFPGMYLLDSTGRVQAKSFLVDHTTRPTAAGLLFQQRKMTAAGGRVEIQTEDLRLVLHLSSTVIRPGQSIVLRAELEINPGLHIYGTTPSDSYLPTVLSLDGTDVVLQHHLRFPPPQLLTLGETEEAVPVYSGTVVVDGELVLKPFLAKGAYRLQGLLRYQACTESECYLPEEVSFEFPLQVEPTTERAA